MAKQMMIKVLEFQISGDGSTLAVGAVNNNSSAGHVRVLWHQHSLQLWLYRFISL